MICPVCKRDLLPTISVCFGCGTMMNDSVREELQTKITSAGTSGRLAAGKRQMLPPTRPVYETPAPKPQEASPLVSAAPPEPVTASKPPMPAKAKVDTGELHAKKTSPTLVEFQNKNTTLPDWRLQLQNSIRQRGSGSGKPTSSTDVIAVATDRTHSRPATNGANALKAEPVRAPEPTAHANPRVASALKRIESSRQAFLAVPTAGTASAKQPAKPNYPFNVVTRGPQVATKAEKADVPATPVPAKPRLVSSLRIEKKGLDTNKLPPLPQPAALATDLDVKAEQPQLRFNEADKGVPAVEQPKVLLTQPEAMIEHDVFVETDTEEMDDLAPFSMRFGAALFDMIIGTFATAVLMSPLMLAGGEWASLSGVLAFGAALAIVLFIYLTASIGFVGRSFGMRLFSLEMIDAEENAYPTLHQAAVSSAVYLLSLGLGGLGFATMLFNEEKRALHDIVSGTILIREI